MLPNDIDPERHVMELYRSYPTGAEEWYCPTCGRRFIMMWPPNYKKIALSYGDEKAVHFGEKNGMDIGRVEVNPPPPVDEDDKEDDDRDWLEPWRGLIGGLDDSDL